MEVGQEVGLPRRGVRVFVKYGGRMAAKNGDTSVVKDDCRAGGGNSDGFLEEMTQRRWILGVGGDVCLKIKVIFTFSISSFQK